MTRDISLLQIKDCVMLDDAYEAIIKANVTSIIQPKREFAPAMFVKIICSSELLFRRIS